MLVEMGVGVLGASLLLKVLNELLGFNGEWPSQCVLVDQHVQSRIGDKNWQWLGSKIGDMNYQWLGPRIGDKNWQWLRSRDGMLSNINHEIVWPILPSIMISHQEMW